MAAIKLEAVERALFVVERTHQIGRMNASMLAQAPGWDRVQAFRYLHKLADCGWLERVTKTDYVLGRKVLALAPDWKGL